MSTRKRLLDFQLSGGAETVGISSSDVASCAAIVNRVQERLITCREAGDHGWFGSYAEMVFNVDRDDPYITLPRGVARIISIAACQRPVPVANQFYEYLLFGDGTLPKTTCDGTVCGEQLTRVLRRNSRATTFGDLTTPGYGLRFYSTAAADVGKRILVGCKDANGQEVFTVDGTTHTRGCYATFASTYADLTLPAATDPLEISTIDSIQKDTTTGIISVYEVNLTTGDQTLLLQMEPSERVASYQRYYISSLPTGCCPVDGSTDTVQLTAMVKLDLVPVRVATDYLLIQSIEAVIAEAQSIRLGESDSSDAKQQSFERHKAAVGFLNGQLVHYEGKNSPSVNFAPFGRMRLSRQRIGSLR